MALNAYICYIFLICCMIWKPLKTAGRLGPEGRLLSHLLNNYSSTVRPILNVTKAIDVNVTYYIAGLLGLNSKEQVLNTVGWLVMRWKDDLLQWNASEHDNIQKIVLSSKLIWVPKDVALQNSVGEIFNEGTYSQFMATVYQDGIVQWSPGGRYATSCRPDIRLYPMDRQQCDLVFAMWSYTNDTIRLQNSTSQINTDKYIPDGEWKLLSTSVFQYDEVYDEGNEMFVFSTVVFRLQLERKPVFYIVNVFAPCMLLSSMSLLIFLLPPDSGEKVALGITVLLSFSVFLLLVADNVPHTSESVPIISIYLMIVMTMAAISLLSSAFVLRLHHRDTATPIPRWLRRIAFEVLPPILCALSLNFIELYDMAADDDEATYSMMYSSSFDVGNSHGDERIAAMMKQFSRFDNNALLGEILQHMREFTARKKRSEAEEMIRQEWRMVAKVLDRVLFVAFLSLLVFLALIILVILPYSY